ncbi:MAG: LysR family transcriptional regulator, partial [Casimicrobium sp.]
MTDAGKLNTESDEKHLLASTQQRHHLSNLTIGDFELFCILVDQGGFREAARYLGLSSSAVSRRIAAIEKQLGTTLLKRSTRNIRLTDPGRRFLSESRQFAAYAQYLGSITGTSLSRTELSFSNLVKRAEAASIFARDTELDEISTSFGQSEAKIVSLVGAGGVGKTVLMRLVAAELDASRSGTCVSIDLAATSDLPQALIAICGKLQISLSETDLLAALIERLQRQARVLVLDNLEQLAGIGQLLLTLVERCSALRMLVTTRRALDVRFERVINILPLGLPSMGCATLEEAEQSPAFRLFLQRVSATLNASTRASLSSEELTVWLQAVRATDGLPLAIELVASRIKHTRLCEARTFAMLETIDENNRVHSSLLACFQSSWYLLSPPQRKLLACLAMIDDVFDIRVAVEVARNAIGIERAEAAFEALLNASLVDAHLENGVTIAYRVLIPIREVVEQLLQTETPPPAFYLELATWTNTTSESITSLRSHRKTDSQGIR